MMKRKAFGPIDKKSYDIASLEGFQIYSELIKRHGNDTTEDLDQVMNSLCFALICLMKNHVDKDNIPVILQVIHKILSENTR